MDTIWEYHYDNCVQRYCLPRCVAQGCCKNEISYSLSVVRPHLIYHIWLILTAASHGSKWSGQPVGVACQNWTSYIPGMRSPPGKRKLCYCNSRSNIVTYCLKTATSITSNCNKVIRIVVYSHYTINPVTL